MRRRSKGSKGKPRSLWEFTPTPDDQLFATDAREARVRRMEREMTRKMFDRFLLRVVLAEGVVAWQTGRERIRLTERHSQLVRVTGDFPIIDPTRVRVRALDTGEPLHFAWRV